MSQDRSVQVGALSQIVMYGALILMLAMGVRATAGIFMTPMLQEHGWSREFFSNVFALQNLAWGAGAILMGMLADRFGGGRAIALSAILYAAGLAVTRYATTTPELVVGFGLLVGVGQGGTTAALVMPMISRAVSPLARSAALGVANAGGSLGQFLVVPAGQLLIDVFDWHAALLILSASIVTIVPLALLMAGRGRSVAAPAQRPNEAASSSLWGAIRDAFRQRSFALLAGSYFVCGFQLAFITLHLPAYLLDNGMSARHGAMAIAVIGLFNVIGSFLVGWLGARYSNKMLLGWIYALRAVFVVQLLLMPVSPFSLYLFSAGTGLLWLSTVPLTMGLVGQIFGLRFAATLGGFVFLSHQIGSATGVWLSGRSFAASGSYDTMWFASIALALIAAALAWMIDERPDRGRSEPGGAIEPQRAPAA
ncbi:MAG TPA: MFS transporter [Burkholderiaceae bacterium]|nr:MFS transporter [Burkholderiaceae bacterium]